MLNYYNSAGADIKEMKDKECKHGGSLNDRIQKILQLPTYTRTNSSKIGVNWPGLGNQ